MRDLERDLVALADAIDWPLEPDLASRVTAKLQRRRRFWPRAAIALALVALAVGIALAVPPARSALLRFFHLRGVTIERVQTLPHARESAFGANLGELLARRSAERRLGFRLALPPDFRPSRVRVLDDSLGSVVLRRDGTTLLLSEFRAAKAVLVKKLLGSGTSVEGITVNGRPGFWITGAAHLLVYRAANGEFRQTTSKVSGNVLLWERGDLTLRLGGRISREDALKLARSIR
jgi:hypothetical protein